MAPEEVACWNVYNSQCLTRQLLTRVADKWTILIIGALAENPKRFGELHRKVDGISKKVLTQSLRSLEQDGLVTRTVYPTSPPAVEYALTETGRSLIDAAQAFLKWTEEHVAEIARNRRDDLPKWERRS